MAVDILNETTLSEALTTETNEFTVASTANITGGTSQLAVMGTAGLEMIKVNAVPIAGRVDVVRGIEGTRSLNHPSGARVFIGNPDAFKTVAGTSPTNYIRLVGASGDFPDYALPGAKAVDGIGNEYVLCELTQTVFSGATVVISVDGNFTASVLASGTHGPCGIVVEPSTSDQYAWVQRRGFWSRAMEAGGTSAATSAYFPVAATSVSTPAAGMAAVVTSGAVAGFTIMGMFITGAAVSTTTSQTSSTGVNVPVYLNYPWVEAAAPGSS